MCVPVLHVVLLLSCRCINGRVKLIRLILILMLILIIIRFLFIEIDNMLCDMAVDLSAYVSLGAALRCTASVVSK